MVSPDEWMVGIIKSNGAKEILTHSSQVTPSRIEEVVFPLSMPWENEPKLYPSPLQQVEVQERNMGPERHYSARLEDSVPNSNQIWEIELELWEYPEGVFNTSDLHHTDQIRNAIWEKDDLLSVLEDQF